jgi:hypothetical protein
MTLVVDINHWLDENGELPMAPLRLRRNALRIVRFIEYGGPLKKLEGRITLIECKKRPKGKSCLGLMWVVKLEDDRIEAHCPACNEREALVSGWQDTLWADGVATALPMNDD